jgi:predicted nucleic acid-binding protein
MTIKAILDTDILSEYLKGHNASVVGRAATYARDHGVLTFTSVTVYEIVYGLEFKGAASQLKKVMAWLRMNEEVTPIDADYLTAAKIKGNGKKAGLYCRAPRLLDCCRGRAAEPAARDWQHRGFPGDPTDRDQSRDRELAMTPLPLWYSPLSRNATD